MDPIKLFSDLLLHKMTDCFFLLRLKRFWRMKIFTPQPHTGIFIKGNVTTFNL